MTSSNQETWDMQQTLPTRNQTPRHAYPWLHMAAILALSIAAPTEAGAMSGYHWKNRPLVVFAPASGAKSLRARSAIIAANRAGFRERDMVVIYVTGNTVRAELGPGPGLSAERLRTRYGVGKNDFRAILVGKDGGSKLQSSSPLPARRLFALIDSMPMRQQEMRQQ